MPNKAMVSARSAISTTIGNSASSNVGGRGPRSRPSSSFTSGDAAEGFGTEPPSAPGPQRHGVLAGAHTYVVTTVVVRAARPQQQADDGQDHHQGHEPAGQVVHSS